MGIRKKWIFRLFTTLFLLVIPISFLTAQEPEGIFSDIIDQFTEQTEDDESIQTITENLNDLLTNPINLNFATEADLQKIILLNDFQVKSILDYRNEFGHFLSMNELLLVPGIRPELFEKVRHFVTISEIRASSDKSYQASKTESDLIVRYKTRFGTPAGFTEEVDSTCRFIGENRYLMTRYELLAGKNFKAGFIAEQDSGEPLFSAHNKYSPDHLSGFIEFNSRKKPFRVIAGDFKAGFGQGLIRGHTSLGRTSNGIILPEKNNITRSLSTSESGHLRGIALQTAPGKLMVSSYVSLVNLDAKISNTFRDEKDFRYFTSINMTGLHRNNSEISNRNTLKQMNTGINMSYVFKNVSIGLFSEIVNYSLPREITRYKPGIDPPEYKNRYCNVSFHYRASIRKTMLFGEWATDAEGNLAFLNGLTTQLHPLASLSMINRRYSATYLSLNASGFGKSSGVKNEEGIYIGFDVYPLSFLSLSCYADHYTFPYLRNNLPAPSSGSDYAANATLSTSRDYQFTIRYKVSHQQIKTPRLESGIDFLNKNRLESWRFVSRLNITEAIMAETRYEQTINTEYPDLISKGNYLGQKMVFRSKFNNTNVYISYGLFDAPIWKNRVYIYEHDLLYDFSIPALYRKGSRFSIMFKTRGVGRSDIWIKYYLTKYPNSIERGSGADRIVSDKDAGIKVQLRVRLDHGVTSPP